MPRVYALLVGIDAYRSPVTPLRGCRADVNAVAALLRDRAGAGPPGSVKELCDADATRDAVIGAFRYHLGRAGPGDTALFWFSGHGSTEAVQPEHWYLEPTGELQTMLCVDSRHGGVPALRDKELAVLIAEVAGRGAHVAVVLDCCHAAGGTRAPGMGVRGVPPPPEPLEFGSLLPELRRRDGGPVPSLAGTGGPDHVALAACRSDQLAYEQPIAHEVRGLFSLGLLVALGRLGAGATYRELLVATRCYVEEFTARQVPVLYPLDGSLADQPFLGGRVRRPAAPIRMRYLRGGWEIDVGSCHGLPPASGEDAARVAVPGSDPVQEARIVRVLTERSTVAPIGWDPDPRRQYELVLSHAPVPATTVAVDAGTATASVAAAIGAAAPGARPSPYLRLVDRVERAVAPELVVTSPSAGTVEITDATGVRLAPAVSDLDSAGAGAVVRDLEHIARWRRVKALGNPRSRLAGAVRVEVVDPLPSERFPPMEQPPLVPGDDGVLRLEYRRGPGGWLAPTAFIRLRNDADQKLYCVLLDLTDRYRMHTGLLPGTFIGPHQRAAAAEGELVEFSLPPDRAVRPGASVRDWLLLLVAEDEFSSLPFRLPRLREPMPARPRAAFGGVLDRLGMLAMYRDADRPASAVNDWTTSVLPVVTRVPDDITGE